MHALNTSRSTLAVDSTIWNTGLGGNTLFHAFCIVRIFNSKKKPSVWGKHERLQDYPKDNNNLPVDLQNSGAIFQSLSYSLFQPESVSIGFLLGLLGVAPGLYLRALTRCQNLPLTLRPWKCHFWRVTSNFVSDSFLSALFLIQHFFLFLSRAKMEQEERSSQPESTPATRPKSRSDHLMKRVSRACLHCRQRKSKCDL